MRFSVRPRLKSVTEWPRALAASTRGGPMKAVPPRMRIFLAADPRGRAMEARAGESPLAKAIAAPVATEVLRKPRRVVCMEDSLRPTRSGRRTIIDARTPGIRQGPAEFGAARIRVGYPVP